MGVGRELAEALGRGENDKVSELLAVLDGEPVNEAGAHGVTPLHSACYRNHVEAVEKILNIPGVDVNARDNDGCTAIIVAAMYGSCDTMRMLLDHPAVEVNARNNVGWTAIMAAAAGCKVEAVRMLLDHPAVEVNARDNDGETAIMLAAAWCEVEAVRMLLDHPAVEVNARDNDGMTAIMVAAAKCNVEAVRMLLDHPAVDLDIRNNDGSGVEEMVGVSSGSSTEKSKCLAMIQEAKKKRQNVMVEPEQASNANGFAAPEKSAEEVRADVVQQYIQQIEQINANIQEREKKIRADLEIKNDKMKLLTEKHTSEKQVLEIKMQQQLAALQDENRRMVDEMNKKHENEKKTLENKFRKEAENDNKVLGSLKDTTDELARDLRKLDLEPANEATPPNMEALRDTLECPVCMEIMRPPTRIWMCSSSHLVCQECKEKIEGRLCPTCRTEIVNLRALMAENFSRTLFNN